MVTHRQSFLISIIGFLALGLGAFVHAGPALARSSFVEAFPPVYAAARLPIAPAPEPVVYASLLARTRAYQVRRIQRAQPPRPDIPIQLAVSA